MAAIKVRYDAIDEMMPKLVGANGKLDETKMKAVFDPSGFQDIATRFKEKEPNALAAELRQAEYSKFIEAFKQRADAL